MTIDHFQSRSQGGEDNPDNLIYSCHACNEFKGDHWQTEPHLGLLHPIFDNPALSDREQENGVLFALTERSENHLQILRLNRPELIAYRLEQREIVLLREQNQALRQQLATFQTTTRDLENEVERTL